MPGDGAVVERREPLHLGGLRRFARGHVRPLDLHQIRLHHARRRPFDHTYSLAQGFPAQSDVVLAATAFPPAGVDQQIAVCCQPGVVLDEGLLKGV